MTATTRIARFSVSMLVLLALIFGLLTVAATDADAQTVTFSGGTGQAHYAQCDLYFANNGGITVNSMFGGPHGQTVAYRVVIWSPAGSGWARVMTQDWQYLTLDDYDSFTGSSYGAASHYWNVTGGDHYTPSFNVWLVEVESYRWINGAWQQYDSSLADVTTVYHGSIYNGQHFPGVCAT